MSNAVDNWTSDALATILDDHIATMKAVSGHMVLDDFVSNLVLITGFGLNKRLVSNNVDAKVGTGDTAFVMEIDSLDLMTDDWAFETSAAIVANPRAPVELTATIRRGKIVTTMTTSYIP